MVKSAPRGATRGGMARSGKSKHRHRSPLRDGFLLALVLAVGIATAAAAGTLTAIDLTPEGRLLRITMTLTGEVDRYTLTRQGPPEQRDLVVRLPGFESRVPAYIDAGEYLMPIEVVASEEAGGGGLSVTFGRVGDALVQVARDAGTLTILIIPPETRSDLSNAYRIGPGDMLQIDVFGHEDLNKTLKVSPAGLINFPLIGNIRVADRTVDEVSVEITQKLEERYLREPHVTVSVWEYLSQWVNVIGEVALPGRYYLTGPTTLVDAISQAGGLTKEAGGLILITRSPDQVDPTSAGEVHRVAISRLFSGEEASLNMTLRPGDVVNVTGAPPPQSARP